MRSIKQCALVLITGLAALVAVACKPKDSASTDNTETFRESPFLALDGAQTQILMMDVGQIRRLPIYDELKKEVMSSDNKSEWESLKLAIGGEPLDNFSRILIASYGYHPEKTTPKLVIGVGQFENSAKLVHAYVDYMKKVHLERAGSVVQDNRNGVPLFQVTDIKYKDPNKAGWGSGLYFAFPGQNMLVFSGELNNVLSTLDVIAGNKANLMTNPQWRQRLGTQGLLGSMLWAAGEFPAEYNKRISDATQTVAGLKNFRHLDNAESFAFRLRFTGREYLLEGDLISDQALRAQAMRDELDKSRAGGKLVDAATLAFGIAPGRKPVLESLLSGTIFTVLETNVRATLRKSPSEGDKLIKDWINPPPPTAGGEGNGEEVAPPAEGGADPFADSN